MTVAQPEGATTTIARDGFGKPLSVTRSGSYGGSAVSAVRGYVYDSNERLCKTIQPESGAALVDYDAAGNLLWSADGTALTGLRKLPRLMDNPKVELSGIFPPGGSNEEVKVQRVADCCSAKAG